MAKEKAPSLWRINPHKELLKETPLTVTVEGELRMNIFCNKYNSNSWVSFLTKIAKHLQ